MVNPVVEKRLQEIRARQAERKKRTGSIQGIDRTPDSKGKSTIGVALTKRKGRKTAVRVSPRLAQKIRQQNLRDKRIYKTNRGNYVKVSPGLQQKIEEQGLNVKKDLRGTININKVTPKVRQDIISNTQSPHVNVAGVPIKTTTKKKQTFFTRLKKVIERDDKLKEKWTKLIKRTGMNVRETDKWYLRAYKGFGQAGLGLIFSGQFIGNAIDKSLASGEGLFQDKLTRSAVVAEQTRAAVLTPSVVQAQFDPRKPENWANLALVAASIAAGGAGGSRRGTPTKPKGRPPKTKSKPSKPSTKAGNAISNLKNTVRNLRIKRIQAKNKRTVKNYNKNVAKLEKQVRVNAKNDAKYVKILKRLEGGKKIRKSDISFTKRYGRVKANQEKAARQLKTARKREVSKLEKERILLRRQLKNTKGKKVQPRVTRGKQRFYELKNPNTGETKLFKSRKTYLRELKRVHRTRTKSFDELLDLKVKSQAVLFKGGGQLTKALPKTTPKTKMVKGKSKAGVIEKSTSGDQVLLQKTVSETKQVLKTAKKAKVRAKTKKSLGKVKRELNKQVSKVKARFKGKPRLALVPIIALKREIQKVDAKIRQVSKPRQDQKQPQKPGEDTQQPQKPGEDTQQAQEILQKAGITAAAAAAAGISIARLSRPSGKKGGRSMPTKAFFGNGGIAGLLLTPGFVFYKYSPSLYSVIYGVRASKRLSAKLLARGRRFSGLEDRPIAVV